MPDSSPLLSVITCNYNHARYLPDAIESALNQKFTPFEHILIDDGSTDESCQIIESYALKYPHIRTHFHAKNQGVLASINEALSLARGKYIHFLSADDSLLEGFFAQSVAALEANPTCGLCSSLSCFFDGHPPQNLYRPEATASVYFPTEVIGLYQNRQFWISGANIMRLDLAKKYGFNPQIEAYNDWFLYQQLSLLHGIVHIPRVYYANRNSETGYSASISTHAQKRNRAFYNLLHAAETHSDPRFKKAFRKSGSLSFYGKNMMIFLLKHLRFWHYIPSILRNKL